MSYEMLSTYARKGRAGVDSLGPEALAQFPALAVMTMECIAAWSKIENLYTRMAVLYLQVGYEEVMMLLEALRPFASRQRMIQQFARVAGCTDADIALWNIAWSVIAPSRKVRHTFAHDLTATSPNAPKPHLCFIPQSSMSNWSALNYMPGKDNSFDPEPVRVFSEAGLRDERARAFEALDIIELLQQAMNPKDIGRAPKIAVLEAHPAIAAQMKSQAKGKKGKKKK